MWGLPLPTRGPSSGGAGHLEKHAALAVLVHRAAVPLVALGFGAAGGVPVPTCSSKGQGRWGQVGRRVSRALAIQFVSNCSREWPPPSSCLLTGGGRDELLQRVGRFPGVRSRALARGQAPHAVHGWGWRHIAKEGQERRILRRGGRHVARETPTACPPVPRQCPAAGRAARPSTFPSPSQESSPPVQCSLSISPPFSMTGA